MNYSLLDIEANKYYRNDLLRSAMNERLIRKLAGKPPMNYRLRVWLSERLIALGTRLQVEAEIINWRSSTPDNEIITREVQP